MKPKHTLDPEVLKHYLSGIRNTDLMAWDRFSESVFYVADFIKKHIDYFRNGSFIGVLYNK